MLLIGSRATSIWHSEHRPKNPKDWDVICSHAQAEALIGSPCDPKAFSWKYGNIELHNDAFFLNKRIVDMYSTDRRVDADGHLIVNVCSSRGLAVIKRSHMYRDFNFTKHMIQYQLLDHDFTPKDLAFIADRMAETQKHFPHRSPFGAMTNEEFIVDAVVRHFDHEELHRIIGGGTVSYLQLKKDMSKAAYDQDLWHAASDEVKQACVREETYVIALERFVIPHRLKGVKYPYRMAYLRALEKVCTTLDDGPLREYAIDNWNIVKQFDDAVFERFFDSDLWRNHDSE